MAVVKAFRKTVSWWMGALLLAGAAQAAEPIRLGSFLATTGPASFLGDPSLKTLQLYVEKVNAAGGVLGRKVELVHYDTGTDTTKALAFAKRLIQNDNVDVIIGGSTSGETLAVIDTVEAAKIPYISLASSEKIVLPVRPWTFKIPASERLVIQKIYTDMQKRGITKVGLVSDTGAYGSTGRQISLEMARQYGIDIIADETYAPTDADVTAQLTKVRAAPGLQAVYVFGFGSGAATVTRNYGQLGFKVPLYQTAGVASKRYIEMSGDAANGVRLPTSALLVADLLPAGDPQKTLLLDFQKAYEAHYKTEINTFAGNAYDAFHLMMAAIRTAGGTDKEKVRGALEATRGLVMTSGTFNMSPSDHNGLDLSAMRMLEIRKGTFQLAE